MERLSLSSLKNLVKKRKVPFSGKNKAELVSLLKGEPLLQLKFISSSKLKRFNAFFDNLKITKTTFQDASKLFKELAERIRKKNKLGKEDMFRIIVSHPSWRRPCSTFRSKFSEELKFFEDIARWVEYKDVPVEELEVEVQSFLIPKGTGRLKATKDKLSRKKSVICIKNRDTMCAARAIVTAVSVLKKDRWTSAELQSLRKSKKVRERKALKLHQDFGVPVKDEECFQEHKGIRGQNDEKKMSFVLW